MTRLTSIISLTILLGSGNLFSQDIITLKNGDEVKSKVTEVTEKEIKYKKYSNLEGPTYSANKSEVFMVKYENGEKEIFNYVLPKPDAASIAPTPLKTTEDKYLRASLFRVYEGNTPITAKEYENKMRTNPTAYNEYQAARSLSITGSIFSAVGGIFSLITLLNEEMLPSARKNANIMSWSGFGLGLALSFVAESKGRKAIDIYNNTQKLNTRLKINGNENGIGLALRF